MALVLGSAPLAGPITLLFEPGFGSAHETFFPGASTEEGFVRWRILGRMYDPGLCEFALLDSRFGLDLGRQHDVQWK